MTNESVIKGLRLISEGFATLAEAFEESPVNTAPVAKAEKPVSKKSEKVEEPVAEVEAEEDDLAHTSYNDLKKLAKELGISAKGGRNDLIEAIKAARANSEAEEDEEEEDEEETTPYSKNMVKDVMSEDDDDAEDEDEEDSEDDEEEEEKTTAEAVEEATEDMSDDELKELLESVGLSSKGKRAALLSRIVSAVDDGLITLDGDDEEDEEEEEEEESEAEDDAEDEEEDDSDADVTKGMSKKRKKAYEELCDSTTNDFNTGDIERSDLTDFIAEFNGYTTKEAKTKFKGVSDEDLLTEYLKLMVNFIDDDGEVVEEGAYTIDNVPYCCGHELEYNKKTKKYTCSVCGEEYESED